MVVGPASSPAAPPGMGETAGEPPSGSGDSPPLGYPQAPVRKVSAKPALIVIGVVAFISAGGALLALFGQGGPTATGPAHRLAGVALSGVPAAKLLSPVVSAGEPPSDVLHSLAVPSGARRTSASCSGGGDLYDCRIGLSVDASPGDVVSFYEAELSHSKWTVLGVNATSNGRGTEVLERLPSNDGYYWEVGVVVEPVAPSITPALGGGNDTAPTSAVELRVFEIDDAD